MTGAGWWKRSCRSESCISFINQTSPWAAVRSLSSALPLARSRRPAVTRRAARAGAPAVPQTVVAAGGVAADNNNDGDAMGLDGESEEISDANDSNQVENAGVHDPHAWDRYVSFRLATIAELLHLLRAARSTTRRRGSSSTSSRPCCRLLPATTT